jgi:hypothetical protein
MPPPYLRGDPECIQLEGYGRPSPVVACSSPLPSGEGQGEGVVSPWSPIVGRVTHEARVCCVGRAPRYANVDLILRREKELKEIWARKDAGAARMFELLAPPSARPIKL